MTDLIDIRAACVCVAVALVGCALLVSPATAAPVKKSRVVISPKPGQPVTKHPVRIVVRAGRERGDVRARLNGVAVGREFRVGRTGRRVLVASRTHGLRYGRNILRVAARRGTRVRRATRVFRVVHRLPLSGAGRDRRIAVGSKMKLRGRLALHPAGPRSRAVRWEVVRAPRRSALRRRGRATTASTGARAATGVLASATGPTPSIRPDVPGRYTVRMTVGSGSTATSDSAVVYAVPPSPFMPVDTNAPGPGIRVGTTVYRAPYMNAAGGGSYEGSTNGSLRHWEAVVQVLVLDRTTLGLINNVTFGACVTVSPGVAEWYPCRKDDATGLPVKVDPRNDLASWGGQEALVIASSHPSPGWDLGDQFYYATSILSEIGFPTDAAVQDELRDSARIAAIGVPGMKPGDADIRVSSDGSGMRGYLTPDQNTPAHYGFAPAARVPFNTRSSQTCDSGGVGVGFCTITQTVGDQNFPGRIVKGQGGYLVSAFEPHSLAVRHSQMFATASYDHGASVRAMTAALKQWSDEGSLIAITSLETPGQEVISTAHWTTGRDDWDALGAEITAIGGTRHRVNMAASGHTDYTLVGWKDAGENGGAEALGEEARVRGVLVPDRRSHFRPANAADRAAPPEQLTQLIMRQPGGSWPLDDDPDARKAIAYIGGQVPQLGSDPRAAYWTQEIDEADAELLAGRVGDVARPAGAPFSADGFTKVQEQLQLELGYVASVRSYMSKLAYPSGVQGEYAWADAKTLQDTLTGQVDQINEEAELSFDAFGLVKGLLETAAAAVGLSEEAELTAEYIEVAAASTELAKTVFEARYDGSSELDRDPTIEADNLAVELMRQADQTSNTFIRLGDIIVSDWSKLQEVGTYGACNAAEDACGQGHEEFAYSPAAQTLAAQVTKRAMDRVIHEELVPLDGSFPVWDTGVPAAPQYTQFFCRDASYPFEGAPRLSWFRALESFDPSGGPGVWRTFLSVHRSGFTYGWLPDSVLKEMFDPADPDWLGIDPLDFMLRYRGTYVPGVTCWWRSPAGD